MQALLFEMKPRDGHEDHYFRHAAALRPLLAEQDGLITIDRFKSLSRPGVILSHSLWRDEASIAKWRTNPQHNKSQLAGRNQHFENYRIRIAHSLAYASDEEPDREWTGEGAYLANGARAPRFLSIVRSTGSPWSEDGESFLSVTSEAAYITISEPGSEPAGRAVDMAARHATNVQSALLCLVSRDYGMFNRAEAPQYFPQTGAQS